MARNVYQSQSGRLAEARQAQRKDILAQEIARMSKQVNQRFYRLEKAGKGIGDTAYYYAQEETGKKKPRYTESVRKLEQMSITELYNYGLKINKKLTSKTSTLSGLEEVYTKRLEASQKALETYNETIAQYGIDRDLFIDFLENGADEYINSKYLDSEQIIEDFVRYVQEGNVSVKQFVRELKRYKNSANIDYGRVTRSWRRIDVKRSYRNKKRKR